MSTRAKVTGLSTVMNNLNTRINAIEGRTLAGIIKGVRLIRRDMDKTAPLIPVDKGNLKASFFIISSDGKVVLGATPKFKQVGKKTVFSAAQMAKLQSVHSSTVSQMSSKAKSLGASTGPFVVFGFGAYYALFVHEMTSSSGISKRALGHMRNKAISGQSGINWTRSGSGPKFLENSVDRNTALVLYTIAKEVKGALR